MATTKNLATVPSTELSNAINLLAEVNGEIVRLPYSLIDEKIVPLEEHIDNENNPHKLDTDDIGAATAQEVQELKTEFSEYKISNDAELAQQKSDLTEYKGKTDVLESRPVNNNILINSNFANPVNQRGYVSGTECASNYTIDRWRFNGKLTIVDKKHIVPSPNAGKTSVSFFQYLESPEIYSGKSLTMSIKCRTANPTTFQLYMDGTANGNYASLGYPEFIHSEANKWEVFSYTFKISDSQVFTLLSCGFNTIGKLDIEWMKIEIGDHATPYVPRLYAEELALCQRYFQKYNSYNSRITRYLTPEMRQFYCSMSIPEMRTNPTIKVERITIDSNTGGTTIDLTIGENHTLNTKLVQFEGRTSDMSWTDGALCIYDIELDAEL